jgi:uncharacterized protein YdaU (DUF1376 family)
MPKKPLYIQLEPGAYPQDTDWQIMTAEERGCYHSLITFIACNDGKISKDPNGLALLCNINIEKLKTFLKKYSHKFLIKGECISHKRVNKELAKARKYIKQKSLAGKKGMQRRYNSVITDPPNSDITKERKGKGREEKGRKEKNYDTNDSSFSQQSRISLASDELKFYDGTCELFGVAGKSDRTTLQNVAKHLSKSLDEKVFDKAWRVAQECKKKGSKPIALFMARMKDEFNYRSLK